MLTKRSREGYLLVDHRGSPGLPPDFMRNAGLIGPTSAEGGLYESATVTCCHCGVVVVINPMRTRARGHCRKCDAYVCDSPACNTDCTPFSKILDDAEKQAFRDLALTQSTGFVFRKDISHG